MFSYEKRLQYPVKIANPNPALAKFIISQYGGPDGVRLRRRGIFFAWGAIFLPCCIARRRGVWYNQEYHPDIVPGERESEEGFYEKTAFGYTAVLVSGGGAYAYRGVGGGRNRCSRQH